MTDYNGPWADERVPNQPIINCVVASCLNAANVECDGCHPATDSEVVALRAVSGDTIGGETLAAGDAALHARYHYPLHARASAWGEIDAALHVGRWVVLIGMIGSLPVRLRTQSASVMHACLAGPRGQWVDPLDRSDGGEPGTRSITPADLKVFSDTGGNNALIFVPHIHTPKHGHIAHGPGGLWWYRRLVPTRWIRRAAITRGFSADTTLARPYLQVMGKTRRMVQLTSGGFKGRWVDVAQFRYTEEV